MPALPNEIANIRDTRKKQIARTRWSIEQALKITESPSLISLSLLLGYHQRTLSTVLYCGRISPETAKRLQKACGQDGRGRWKLPKELIAPEHYGND